MKNILAIFKKEFRYFFGTPIGYIVLFLFWLAISLFLWVIPGNYNIIDSGYAQLNGLFEITPWLFLFLCPALTMRMIAEERQNHTWDILATKPIEIWQVVLGKFLAAWCLNLIALLPCIFHYYVVYNLAEPIGNVDSGAFWGAFIGLIFMSATYCAIGLWASATTKNQLESFLLAMVVCFILFYGFDLVSGLVTNGSTIAKIQNIGFNAHYKSISRGIIDSRDMIYFLSLCALFIIITIKQLSVRK